MTHNPRRSFAERASASAGARHRRTHEKSASSGVILCVLFGVGILVAAVFWATRAAFFPRGRPVPEENASSAASDSSASLDYLARMNESVAEAEVPKAKPKKMKKKKRTVAKGDPFDQASARDAAEPSDDDSDRRGPVPQVAQRVETRVVALRLSGNVASTPLDPNDQFTWGRLGYFFQQELSPRYFLLFPSGNVPTIVKGPTMFKGRVVKEGQDLRDLRPPPGPRGSFGSPRYRIDLQSDDGRAGSITFYGGKIGQNYRCRLSVQIFNLEGEQPSLVDTFTITETVTRLARGATGPRDRQAYEMAIEKLVKRLQSSPYFR